MINFLLTGYYGNLSYIYPDADWYNCVITAENLISSMSWNLSLPVQIVIVNFIIQPSIPITYGIDHMLQLGVDEGSHIEVSLSINGSFLNHSTFNWMTKSGEALVAPDNYVVNGYYLVQGNASNLVTPTVSVERWVWIDYAITNLTVDVDHLYVPVGDNSTFHITMDYGSRLNFTWDWVDNATLGM